MEGINWAALIAAVDDGYAQRVALFDERFPVELGNLGDVGWFTTELALGVLQQFAGAWPTLGRNSADPAAVRSLFVPVDGVGVVRFVARNLAHPDDRGAQVVVFTVVVARAAG